MGIESWKIEGRRKSGENAHLVGSAYRMALDDETKIPFALQNLELDFGRQKTGYFTGCDIKTAISEETSTGIYLGKVERVLRNKILISSNKPLEAEFRLRILGKEGAEPVYVVVKNPVKENGFYIFETKNQKIDIKSRVFLTKNFRINLKMYLICLSTLLIWA